MDGTTAWQRLGELLQRRRVELGVRYRNLGTFADERDINYRLAWDLESGARQNYRRPTLRAVEVAYGWQPGSIDTVLAGGDPVPSSAPAAAPPARDELATLTPEQYEALTPGQRRIARELIEGLRRTAQAQIAAATEDKSA